MTEVQAAIAAARAAAAEEARLLEAAVRRAAALAGEARELVGVPGDDGWLGIARAAFDDRCARERLALDGEGHELQLLAAALRGAV